MKFLVFALLAIAVASGDLIKEQKKICEPGTLSKVDCNDCICSKDGTSQACTLMLCPPVNSEDTRVRRQTEEKICQPGETKMEDCNSCFCTQDGTAWGCTLMGCPEKTIICEPGTRYKKYCNSCACGSDGTSEICTRMECPKNIYNADGSLVNPESSTKNPLLRERRQIGVEKPCVPGTSFKRFCNSCFCGTDGITAACTAMFCPEGFYNEDGSLKNVERVPTEPLPLARSNISS